VNEQEPTQGDGGMRDEMQQRLLARVNSLEKELKGARTQGRILGVGLMASLAAAVFAILTSMDVAGGADVIEARQIVLLGPDGQPRGEWAVDPEGNSTLSMLDREQRQRLTLTVRGEGYPGLSLSNTAGQRRVALGLLPDETASLVFADGGGVARNVLGLVRGDAASLVLADGNGAMGIGFGLDGRGVGSVILPDEEMDGEAEDPGS
jgi:hypothetical protein